MQRRSVSSDFRKVCTSLQSSSVSQATKEPGHRKKQKTVIFSEDTLRYDTTIKERGAEDNSHEKACIGHNWRNVIPDELLLEIFLYLVKLEGGAVPVLCRYLY